MAELTDDQLAQLKKRLQDLYLTLREGVRTEIEDADGQHYQDLAGAVPDPGDASVADTLVDTSAALTDKQVTEMREVQAALERLADLDFGDCEECGGEIGFERLMAYPTAQRCIRCQELHEKTYAHENKPTLWFLPSAPGMCRTNRPAGRVVYPRPCSPADALSSTSTAPLPPS